MKGEEADEGFPVISVAMCTYNGEKYLAEQLESILGQTYDNLEVVIVDDGSSDGTLKLLDEYRARDARIRVIRNERNLGFLKSFERALQSCTGDFIALADQDDIWYAHKIAALYRSMGESLLIYSRVSMINADGQSLDGEFPSVKRLQGDCALSLVMGNCVTGHACLVRRSLLDRALPFPAGVKMHDQWLAIVAASMGRLKAGDEVLSLYRKHDSNAVLKKKGKADASRHVRKEQSDDQCIRLVGAMLDSGFFDGVKREKLNQFRGLLSRNKACFYNQNLDRFLMENREYFLQLFRDERKAVKKLCRGGWYFRLLPFA